MTAVTTVDGGHRRSADDRRMAWVMTVVVIAVVTAVMTTIERLCQYHMINVEFEFSIG